MIGVFDSGVGGLFCLRDLKKKFPNESFLYLADVMHFPYGERDPDFLRCLTKKNVEFLISKGATIVIVACNTASSVLNEDDFPYISLYGMVEPTLQQAHRVSRNKKLGLMATKATVLSQIYPRKIEEMGLDLQIESQACPLLAPFVEETEWQKNKKGLSDLLQKYLTPLIEQGVDTILLACTHYLYLREAIQNYIGSDKYVVGPSQMLIKSLESKIIESSDSKKGQIFFFTNGESLSFERKCLEMFEREKISVTKIL